jgi:hypothetical protein
MKLNRFLTLLLMAGVLTAGDESSSTAEPTQPPQAKKALNKVLKGRVVKIKKKRVTLYYDFEDPEQLQDFQGVRPPRLLDASQNRFRIAGGRLVLEGSTCLRHKVEGQGELRARFSVRISQQKNIGTVFTEPILSDYFVICNLFDYRFYNDGGMILASCGLHEDEGANLDMALVNWRDIFRSGLKNKVKVGEDVEMEVYKNGWEEYARVGDTQGKGSSKGKCKYFETYQFGFFVHHSRATFDDLTLSIELPDEFLELYDLEAAIDLDWEDVPTTGPLAGIPGVPPRRRRQIEAYAAGRGSAREVFRALASTGLPKEAREAAAQVLCERGDPKAVPVVVDGLYSQNVLTRKLSFRVVKLITGKSFGYSPTSGEKARTKALEKLNAHLVQNRDRYYG